MDYRESRAYIEDAAKYGSVLGLDHMRELMELLHNPQESLSIIHVAGTNGKGSVIAFLYSVLRKSGYKVGRYISPTLFSYRERLEVSGKQITQEEFAACVSEVALAVSNMKGSHPTPFELETAAAFLYFKQQDCDLVLLEVGMGGDLDATNVFSKPVLSVITSVSVDHQAFLGQTLYEIAQKKAGIIKPGCPVVSAKQEPDAERALKEACRKCLVSYQEANPLEADLIQGDVTGLTFRYQENLYRIRLSGLYQIPNAVLALNALDALEKNGYPTSLADRKEGLAEAGWKGRFTVIGERPLFLIDGAHNPAAADMLAESIRTHLRGRTLIYIMGVFSDKDYQSVIQKTCGFADQVFTIQTPDNPRALSAEQLAEEIRTQFPELKIQPMNSIAAAVQAAEACAGSEDAIVAFGSLSFMGELCHAVEQERNEK